MGVDYVYVVNYGCYIYIKCVHFLVKIVVIFDLYDVISVTSNKPQITTINLEHTFHICLGGEADIFVFLGTAKRSIYV